MQKTKKERKEAKERKKYILYFLLLFILFLWLLSFSSFCFSFDFVLDRRVAVVLYCLTNTESYSFGGVDGADKLCELRSAA